MDYQRTIKHAQAESDNKNNRVKYYSTKFEPPKKIERNKPLSANIQKFLARKEQEEKQKALEAKQRRDKLLELRSHDKKATRRVNVMLRRTKSANQSAIEDAVDKNNTQVTLAGCAQPDEDDYGYVSQSASEYYNKMMEKYNSMPEEQTYNLTKKKVSTNMVSTKERVKIALDKEREEATMPHRRKRIRNGDGDVLEVSEAPAERIEDKSKVKVKAAPVINFNDLLKIAEKKQFEPIKIAPKKEKEEERPLTKKQKREQEKEKEYREQREKRDKERKEGASTAPKPVKPEISRTTDAKPDKPNKANVIQKKSSVPAVPPKVPTAPTASTKISDASKAHLAKMNSKPGENSRATASSAERHKTQNPMRKDMPRNLSAKQRPFPPPNGVHKRPPQAVRGRIYDDDEEYDSEMDDFIDDGPEEEEDYSTHIRELFGYDKRKYRHLEDDEDNMESSFAQQMREEVISTKIGIMEDIEELRKEEERSRRKAMLKKQHR